MPNLPIISKVLRTPDACFSNLPNFPYSPKYLEVGGLRIAYIDEGSESASPVLLMHGEPTWSFLYRKIIPVLLAEGHRVIAPDLVGFGRSDKPAAAHDYSYLNQVLWMNAWLQAVNLHELTLFSSRDPITIGGERIWQESVPGAKGQAHAITRGAGHLLQEDKGEEVARAIAEFIRSNGPQRE